MAGAAAQIAIVRLGDASIASPFTCRQSSIYPTTRIIQQGRCTLVTTMEIYKIQVHPVSIQLCSTLRLVVSCPAVKVCIWLHLIDRWWLLQALTCLTLAYCLSALYLDGVKLGDQQVCSVSIPSCAEPM